MSNEMQQIARRLQEIREISDFSAAEIAARLKLSEAKYLDYEEKGENIPIGVLFKLSNIYGIDVNELLTGQSPRLDTYCLVRKGQSIGVDRYPGYRYESMAYKFKRRIMEPLMVTVEPDNADKAPNTHTGQEFNYVVEGTVMVILGDEELVLEAGDCVYFDATLPHGQKAVGKAAKFIAVIAE
ncbi:MAG: cupin domain-containing protein [Oscillospiraceae bacterium]|nr:cupin domain-containing protein [Oscillospiraceae bacterium]